MSFFKDIFEGSILGGCCFDSIVCCLVFRGNGNIMNSVNSRRRGIADEFRIGEKLTYTINSGRKKMVETLVKRKEKQKGF